MENATVELARQMLQRRHRRNNLQDIVVRNRWQYRRAQWIRLNNEQLLRFPRLTIDYLKDLTVGIYQINLGCSYVQDKLLRDNEEEIQIDQHFDVENVIRLHLYSRYRNRTTHQIFISYIPEDEVNPGEELIDDYYCTCQSGARTLGTCAHIASILWYLGYARHQENIRYPDESLLNTSRDAANRWNEDAEGIEIIEEV